VQRLALDNEKIFVLEPSLTREKRREARLRCGSSDEAQGLEKLEMGKRGTLY